MKMSDGQTRDRQDDGSDDHHQGLQGVRVDDGSEAA